MVYIHASCRPTLILYYLMHYLLHEMIETRRAINSKANLQIAVCCIT